LRYNISISEKGAEIMASKYKRTAGYVTEIALAAALISVCSMISIPFAVPFTMQLFGVYFALFFLGGRWGCAAVLLYLAIGTVGLPVFSGFAGGVGRLFDSTGGFLWGFLLLSLVYAVGERALRGFGKKTLIITALSLLSFYTVGAVWYAAFYASFSTVSIFATLSVTVLPFVLPDAIKIYLAYILAKRLKNIFAKKTG